MFFAYCIYTIELKVCREFIKVIVVDTTYCEMTRKAFVPHTFIVLLMNKYTCNAYCANVNRK